jgi:hypothetical protein
MQEVRGKRFLKLGVLCVLAALLNILLNYIFMVLLGFPLFMDNVFTAAIAFSAGLLPGVAVAVLTWLFPCLYYKVFQFFFICSITEVLLICALKPAAPSVPDFASKDKIIAIYTGIAVKLLLLYIICALTISILGGVIDYLQILFMEGHEQLYSVEHAFKLGLVMNNFPVLAVCILSRIPVNLVDRFIVIVGGYLISLGLGKLGIRNEE